MLNCYGVFTPEQDNAKTTGVKGIIEMHRFNICLVVLLWCENTITLLVAGALGTMAIYPPPLPRVKSFP